MLKFFQYYENELVVNDFYTEPKLAEFFCKHHKYPYIITDIDMSDDQFNPYYRCHVLTCDSPIPVDAFCSYNIIRARSDYPTNDFCIAPFKAEPIESQDYKNLLIYYDRLVMEQVQEVISKLDWNQVKQEGQHQFILGLRLVKVNPTIALQICLDAYNFDAFEFNYLNPNSYLSAITTIVNIIK